MKKYNGFLSKKSVSFDRLGKIMACSMLSAISLFMLNAGILAQTALSFDYQLANTTPEESVRLQSLTRDLHPTVYLTNGEQKVIGQGSPLLVICDAASVNLLYKETPAFNQVELIRLTINSPEEQNMMVNLLQLKSFSSLKYIYLLFSYDACGGRTTNCLAEKVGGMVQGVSSPLTILFSLAIPE